MKETILFLLVHISTSVCLNAQSCKEYKVKVNNIEYKFPMLVSQVSRTHGLNYKPPGYFYKNIVNKSNNILFFISYNSENKDLWDENKSQDYYNNYSVNGYFFHFKDTGRTVDSLRSLIETTYRKRMIFVKARHHSKKPYNLPASFINALPDSGIVNYNILRVDNCFCVGLRKKPEFGKKDRKVEVSFFFNQSDEQVKRRLMSY